MTGGGKVPKARARPSFDKALVAVTDIAAAALILRWSPKELRKQLRAERCVCPKVWGNAVRKVFGAGVRELPDLRQLPMFGGAT